MGLQMGANADTACRRHTHFVTSHDNVPKPLPTGTGPSAGQEADRAHRGSASSRLWCETLTVSWVTSQTPGQMGGAATALTGGNTPHPPLPNDAQYLVFPRVPQGADKRPVATHGVSADGRAVGVGGEVSVDQFGKLQTDGLR